MHTKESSPSSLPQPASLACFAFRYSVPLALTRLQVLLDVPLNAREAIIFFWQRQDRGIYLYLYRKYLPDDYRLSEESEEIVEEWGYSRREVEFFFLVQDNLFPLDIDYISEIGANGERMTELIALIPYEMPWLGDLESLSLEWQILAYLSGTLSMEEVEQKIQLFVGLPEDLLVQLQSSARAMIAASLPERETVRRFFLDLDTPYGGFGLVLALYQRRTGIGWLDTWDDEILYEDFCWCDEHFGRLIVEYRAAQQFEERANAFALWLREDILHRVSQLLSLLEQYVPPLVEKPKRSGRRKKI